jgi:hypothetical protein
MSLEPVILGMIVAAFATFAVTLFGVSLWVRGRPR